VTCRALCLQKVALRRIVSASIPLPPMLTLSDTVCWGIGFFSMPPQNQKAPAEAGLCQLSRPERKAPAFRSEGTA